MNLHTIVGLGFAAVGAYLFLGLFVTTAMHVRGLHRIDSGTADAGIVFRLLITPGMVALWPLLLKRWRAAIRPGPQFGQADQPRSFARLRSLHRKLVIVTAIVVSAFFAIGLMARPGAPRSLEGAGQVIPDPQPMPAVSAVWQDPFPGLPISVNLRTDDSGRQQIDVMISHDLQVPDTALYWLDGDGSGPLGTGVFLGVVWGPDRRRIELERDGFVLACRLDDLVDGKGHTAWLGSVRVAVFHHKNRVWATSNVCRHQGGPLGEVRIIDGSITCPWHGWQYQPENGFSPPPFDEKIATHETLIVADDVWVKAVPASPGTPQSGAPVEEVTNA